MSRNYVYIWTVQIWSKKGTLCRFRITSQGLNKTVWIRSFLMESRYAVQKGHIHWEKYTDVTQIFDLADFLICYSCVMFYCALHQLARLYHSPLSTRMYGAGYLVLVVMLSCLLFRPCIRTPWHSVNCLLDLLRWLILRMNWRVYRVICQKWLLFQKVFMQRTDMQMWSHVSGICKVLVCCCHSRGYPPFWLFPGLSTRLQRKRTSQDQTQ